MRYAPLPFTCHPVCKQTHNYCYNKHAVEKNSRLQLHRSYLWGNWKSRERETGRERERERELRLPPVLARVMDGRAIDSDSSNVDELSTMKQPRLASVPDYSRTAEDCLYMSESDTHPKRGGREVDKNHSGSIYGTFIPRR